MKSREGVKHLMNMPAACTELVYSHPEVFPEWALLCRLHLKDLAGLCSVSTVCFVRQSASKVLPELGTLIRDQPSKQADAGSQA